MPDPLRRVSSGCARFVSKAGQNIHLPLAKKSQAGFEIARCFESALKELPAIMCSNR